MKKTFSFVLIYSLLMTLSACNKAPSVPAGRQDTSYTVEANPVNQKITTEDGKVLISVDLSLPSLKGSSEAEKNVNIYYSNVMDKYLAYARLELKPAALEHMKMYPGPEFNPYFLSSRYSVTLNTKEYLSFSREFEYYTGGAHPGVTLNGETFSMKNGGLMNLSDVFSVPAETYLGVIYKEVLSQIESPGSKIDKANLFENYKELVKTDFDPSDFYLTPGGITVFYQLYSIAPYVAGVQYFTIPYEKFDGMLKIRINKI